MPAGLQGTVVIPDAPPLHFLNALAAPPGRSHGDHRVPPHAGAPNPHVLQRLLSGVHLGNRQLRLQKSRAREELAGDSAGTHRVLIVDLRACHRGAPAPERVLLLERGERHGARA